MLSTDLWYQARHGFGLQVTYSLVGLMGKKIGYYNIYAVAFILKIFILTTISRFRPMWFVFNIAHNFISLLSFWFFCLVLFFNKCFSDFGTGARSQQSFDWTSMWLNRLNDRSLLNDTAFPLTSAVFS